MATLALALSATADVTRARDLAAHALEAGERAFGPRHPAFCWLLLNVASVHRRLGDAPEAQRLAARALSLFEEVFGPSHVYVADALTALAASDWDAGDLAAARRHALRAKGLLREHVRGVAPGVSEREALAFQAVRTAALHLALSALVVGGPAAHAPSELDETWDELARSRALVLDEMAARHRAVQELETPEATALQDSLARARSRLARMVSSRSVPDDPAEAIGLLEEALREKERLERQLAQRSAAFRRSEARSRAGIAEVAAALPSDAALVAYARYHRLARPSPGTRPAAPVPSYLAFVMGVAAEASRRSVVPLGTAESIEGLVRRWQEEAGRPPEDAGALERYRAAGAALRRAVWDPVAGRFGAARRVFVVMDGTLHLVNVATLPAAGGAYLLETGPVVHSLSAERDLLMALEDREPGHGVLVVGGPDFDAPPDPGPAVGAVPSGGGIEDAPTPAAAAGRAYLGPRAGCTGFRSLRFEPLPGAGAEADEVASLVSKRRAPGRRAAEDLLVLTGTRATEAAFKRNAPGRRILHLATHGFFVQDRCESGLETASSGEAAGSWPSDAVTGENPLLLSGLALAGANRRDDALSSDEREDGILTAEEIASLDLGGVELAVLSACGTGLGPVQTGEGVLGMRRTFEVAGARGLVLSLWPVEDHLARDWIRRLYGAALEGSSPAEAARRAALAVLEARRRAGVMDHPYSWGAFVATGNWR